jgi:hypothetical protein
VKEEAKEGGDEEEEAKSGEFKLGQKVTLAPGKGTLSLGEKRVEQGDIVTVIKVFDGKNKGSVGIEVGGEGKKMKTKVSNLRSLTEAEEARCAFEIGQRVKLTSAAADSYIDKNTGIKLSKQNIMIVEKVLPDGKISVSFGGGGFFRFNGNLLEVVKQEA